MGNVASGHNLQNDCIQSELNVCYSQQYLRRATVDTKNKTPAILSGRSSGRNVADCKVLPKPTENLKLRATTNGAILQAGGTISFRAKEPLVAGKNEQTSFYPMRRCHTLILDGQNETMAKRSSPSPSLTEFRRSQTMLFVGYNKRKSPENLWKNFDSTPKSTTQIMPSSSTTLKVNKYNKKRKAPLAPTKHVSKEEVLAPSQLLDNFKNSAPAKSRIYSTNNHNKAQKPCQPVTMKVTPFQRDSNAPTPVHTARPSLQANSSYASKLPYRRDQNLDIQLLSKRKTNDSRDESNLMATTKELEPELEHHAHESNERKQLALARQQSDVVTDDKTYRLTDSKVEQEKPSLNKITKFPNFTEYSAATSDRKAKYPQSRIPQLKRTFYFGMDSVNKSTNQPASFHTKTKTPAKMTDNLSQNSSIGSIERQIDADREILDNGILVHVRPTLPRRQLETPSFSPAAAWRNLLEEQQCLQLKRATLKPNSKDQRIIETPIYFKDSAKEKYAGAKANWTPQQDLDDDDDEEEKEVKKADNFPSSLHIFSLSLPRDVHLQCQSKSLMQLEEEQENNLKSSNCWLVPGFNSLQKFRSQLGKPTGIRSNNKCTCAFNSPTVRLNYQYENISGADTLAMGAKSQNHQPSCELNKTATKPAGYQNNNWLLHKSVQSKDLPTADKAQVLDNSCLKPSTDAASSFINFQPKSLSNICSGKHIVYLPGQDLLNSSIKVSSYKNSKQNRTNKSNYKRQRQSQENVRESLQDLAPIQNIHQSNVNATEKNTHRFSFQSTVRVLEKRRLAERLSKDAEVQEAQRLNELEVMKRVEEDFQRKRAPEKADLRKQLRLHFKTNAENAEYRSLPLNINVKFNSQMSDANNNIFCRAEPDGAVSPSREMDNDLPKVTHSNSNFLLPSATKMSKESVCYTYDGEESESETQLPDLQCAAALLIEPYLNSVI